MTFDQIQQALYDQLGLTGQEALVTRAINEGKDRYVSARKWAHLESTANQLFTSGVRSYTALSSAAHIVGLYDPNGKPLDGDIDRDTYDQLYRPDTATAALPTVYREDGTESTGVIKFHIWPSPSANTTGSLRFLVRPGDLTSTATAHYDHIPSDHHFVIQEFALARFFEWEGDATKAGQANRRAEFAIQRLAGEVSKEIEHDEA